MIKVSRMADYAILLMCKMANNSDFIYSAHELSITTLLPITTISKILGLDTVEKTFFIYVKLILH